MPLEKEDLQAVQDLITSTVSSSLKEFLKDSVAPMVSGAAKRAISEAPQLTSEQLQEQLKTFAETFQSQIPKPVDQGELVKNAVNSVLQQLADMPDDSTSPVSSSDGSTPDISAIKDQIRSDLMSEFQGTQKQAEEQAQRMRAQLEALQKQAEDERQRAEEARKLAETERLNNQISIRNQSFVDAMLKTGQVDPGAGALALQAALSAGYILPHPEDPGKFVVKEKDSLGLDDVMIPAEERLEKILEKPELQYFRPARSGTGTGAAPDRNTRPGQANLQVLRSPDSVSADEILNALKNGDESKVLQDLSVLDRAS